MLKPDDKRICPSDIARELGIIPAAMAAAKKKSSCESNRYRQKTTEIEAIAETMYALTIAGGSHTTTVRMSSTRAIKR